MKLYSIIKKVYHIVSAKTIYNKNFVYPNIYLFNQHITQLAKLKKILFYFNSSEYMHLGDHIFFLPLVKVFVDSGYDVRVCTTPAMSELFTRLNLPVIAPQECNFNDYELIISRFELIRRLNSYACLLVHVSKNITLPISEHMLHNLSKLFHLVDYQPFNFYAITSENILSKLHLPTNKKLVLFNLYCDASSYLLTERKCQLLLAYLSSYAHNEDYQIILVGSQSDKESDKRTYDFQYIDLRGKTSVLDIFSLVAAQNAHCYIGFDSFVMHVFSLYQKPSFVVFRGRITRKQSNMLREFHTRLFSSDKFVTLIA